MTASTNEFTVKTPAGLVSGPMEFWFAALLHTMSPEQRGQVLEYVKQMQHDQLVLLNPDGTRTTVLRAERGILKASGSEAGG